MIDGNQTYTVDHWMRDLIKQLLNLSHEQWLAKNLMKHHHTKGAIAIKTKKQLARQLDKLLDKDIHNIQDRDRWLLDLQQSDIGEMSLRQLQYTVFTLRSRRQAGRRRNPEDQRPDKRLCTTCQDGRCCGADG